MKTVNRFGGDLSDSKMKYCTIIWLVLLTLLASCTDSYRINTHLLLDRGWKFKTVDDLHYARPEHNDSDWSSIQIAEPWQKQGYDYVGFGWYRVKIFIPSSLKEQAKSDSIKIFLGDILDAHQLFINGSIVGENGLVVPITHKTDSSFLDMPLAKGPKKFVISVTDSRILWDKENVLAVRFFNKKNNGGMISGVPYIGVVGLEDYIEYGQKFYKPDSTGTVDTNLVMTNFLNKSISGDLYINGRVIETDKEVFKTSVPITLKPGESKSIPVSLPMTTDQTRVLLRFNENLLKEAVYDSLIVPFVLVK